MTGSRVVVLGGGFGGVAAALEAKRLLGDDHDVTLIDRHPVVHLCGANPLVAVGRQEPGRASRALPRLEEHGVKFLAAEVGDLGVTRREVTTSVGPVLYDYLVVALGAGYDWDAVPGSRGAHSFYDYDSTVALRAALDAFDGGRILVGVAAPPIKCPPAPFEMAMLLDAAFWRRAMRPEVDIHVAIPEMAPMAVAGTDAVRSVRQALESKRITLHTEAPVTAVDGHAAILGDGTEIGADLAIVVPRHELPDVVKGSGLATSSRWVPVDSATLETSIPGVFAVGDVNVVPAGRAAVPKAGVFAAGEGRTAAAVIAARVLGTAPPPAYDGAGHCFLAFSETESAMVGGTFLAAGGPDVGLGQPSPDGMVAKDRFEQDWIEFRI